MATGHKRRRDPPATHRALECRSFWRAGSYDVNPAAASSFAGGSLDSSDFERARVHPKFLHTNATSHKWAFGAIAELIDNAVDEICNGATFMIVDKVDSPRDSSPILVFQDDGGGMDPEGLRRCMSLGFSSKRSKKTIGQYGNGFKTSTMRLGADAIVFTCANSGSCETQSIGMLSYTYLRRTFKDDIIVPSIDFEMIEGQEIPLLFGSQKDWDGNLKTILDWSPFSTREELMRQLKDVGSHGTKILVYNLWLNDDGLLELDFDDDDEDILLRDQTNNSGDLWRKSHKEIIHSHISYTLKYSLRAYLSVLYLQKFIKFQIILRGNPVEQLNIADELKFQKVLTYKPQVGIGSENVSVKITIGFAKEAPLLGIFGLNVYHKNRLVKPFWKVLQEGSSRGRNVIGFLEANFIEPAHDKQDFERTPLFLRLETKLKQIVIDYWKNNCHLIGYQSQNSELRHRQKQSSNVQCDFKAEESGRGHPVGFDGATIDHCLATVNDSTAIPSAEAYHVVSADQSEMLVLMYVGTLACLGPKHGEPNNADPQWRAHFGHEDCEVMEPVDVLDSSSIEKLSEENLELFARRGELQSNNERLKETIEKLEHELERWKRKCSNLAMEVENRRKLQGSMNC